MITAVQWPGNEQILARHVDRLSLSQCHQCRLHHLKTFIEAKDAFDLFVIEDKRHFSGGLTAKSQLDRSSPNWQRTEKALANRNNFLFRSLATNNLDL